MNYYELLGVNKNASQEEIKKKYRELVKKHHPDVGGDTELFKKINEAYEILKDPVKRQQYDNPVQHQFNSFDFSNSPFDDIDLVFSTIFGQKRQNFKNKDIRIKVDIDLEDCVRGKNLEISYMLSNGQRNSVTIDIPAGIDSGNTIRYQGLGDNQNSQLPRGDLLVVVHVSIPNGWQRNRNDLIVDKNINVLDLLTGCSTIIESLDNQKLSLKIPSGTKPETMFSMKGLGLTDINTGKNGNLYVRIKAIVPVITDKNLIKEIESIKTKLA